MTGRELADALRCGKPNCACKRGNRVHCANSGAHHNGDANPSLSVTESGGTTLLHCHGGCSQDDVISALKERSLWGEESRLPTPIRSSRGGKLTAIYEFRNADGQLVAEHGRFETASGKSFAWRVPGKDWRDGLGSVAIHDLPLYRLADVLASPEAPVWFCEGEKAVEACVAQGLVAVCAGGGASQKTFGNALDVLASRDVILWPDADEPGGALMGRIHSLLPHSRFVRPVVEPKGDAHDYFQGGGTVAALYELLSESTPTVAMPALDAVTVTIPIAAGSVKFEFSELQAAKRETQAALRITVDSPGKRRTPFSTRLNLDSSSARSGTRTELNEVYGKDFSWAALLSEACGLAKETWHGVDYSIDLVDVALSEERPWAVDKWAPEGLVTIPFGMGGSGKSYVCGDIALCCLYGMPWMGKATKVVKAVMVIDYEDREDEWRRRIQEIADGHGWPFPESGYRYLSGRAIPVADQVVQIKRMVEEWGIGLIIVDSAVSACGGDLLDVQAATRLINALTDIGATTLLIAHNTKAQDSDFPYGNIFWHNLARATHYIESTQEDGSNVVESVIWNRKQNRGKQKPIPLRMTFPDSADGPVLIEMTASIPPVLQSASDSQRWTILEFVKNSWKPLNAKEISEGTGIPEPQVRTSLSKNKKWYIQPQRGLYAAISERDEAAF
jgi:hypothetical protein